MKKMLLLLLALTVAPVWAEDVATPLPTQTVPAAKSECMQLALLSTDTPATPESTLSCPAGCFVMNCPPPSGPLRCCHTYGTSC